MILNKFNKKIKLLKKKYLFNRVQIYFFNLGFVFKKIKSKDGINRDLKLALTSSNNDAQQIYNQLRQLNTNLTELQQKYDQDIAERNQQIEILYKEQKQLIVFYFIF